jgi:macrolide-specific efflux system membrane fusion protein
MKTRLAAIALIAVGLGAIVLSVVGWPSLGESSDSKYITQAVSVGTVSAESVANGTIGASTVYGLKFGVAPDVVSSVAITAGSSTGSGSSSLTWPVETVSVVVGQTVKKGDKLATADDTSAQIQLLQAESNTQSAQTRLSNDESNSRISNATLLADKVALATAQQAMAAAVLAVADATIVAPADGLITAVNILPGANAPSDYAIQLAAGPMVATASFAEADITNIKVGQAASVTVTAAKTAIDGTVSQIVPVAATSGGGSSVVGYTVTVTLGSAPDTVLSGMSATVTVTTASVENVLRVPATALNGSASAGYTVLVVGSDGATKTVSVEVGLVTTSYAQISSGLNQGQAVVVGTTSTRNTTTGGGGVNLGGLTGGFGGGFGR